MTGYLHRDVVAHREKASVSRASFPTVKTVKQVSEPDYLHAVEAV